MNGPGPVTPRTKQSQRSWRQGDLAFDSPELQCPLVSRISDLEARTRNLPPVVRQAGWRALSAARTPVELARYIRTRGEYRQLADAEPLHWRDAQLELSDRMAAHAFDRHYFFQDIWAARRIAELRPEMHVDVASRVDLVGFLTAICPVTFVDIRPLEAEGVEDLHSVAGTLERLPFDDHALESVSCLHVVEHIGLGRYGDLLDPNGTVNAIKELARVTAVGGSLLISTPVGRARTCWNAHRVSSPETIPSVVGPSFELREFAGVDDEGRFARHRDPAGLDESTYACGMYHLVRTTAETV